MTSEALDEIVLLALREMTTFLRRGTWRGRENELVSLYAFGFLLPRACAPAGPLRSTQIGIEVAVPQVTNWSPKQKADVRKDLVIWRYPDMTHWNRSEETPNPVLAIMEWKSLNNVGVKESPAQKRRDHEKDVDWLSRATSAESGLTGYAIFVDLQRAATVSCRIIRGGHEVSTSPHVFPGV